MRLAGTCSRYSNSAIPQLTIAATYHAWRFRLRRCPYQANVMNTFDAISSSVVFASTGTSMCISPLAGSKTAPGDRAPMQGSYTIIGRSECPPQRCPHEVWSRLFSQAKQRAQFVAAGIDPYQLVGLDRQLSRRVRQRRIVGRPRADDNQPHAARGSFQSLKQRVGNGVLAAGLQVGQPL